MLVFWKARLVLLAVPKTGTTALEEALGPQADLMLRNPPQIKHATLQRYRRFIEPLLAAGGRTGFETVAVVREPVSWLSSWYRYRWRDAIVGQPTSTRDLSFGEFVEEWCKGKPEAYASVGTQSGYVFNEDGTRAVNHLFRHDRPEAFHEFLRDRLGALPPLPRANVSPEVETPLSPEMLERARRKRPDIFRVWEEATR